MKKLNKLFAILVAVLGVSATTKAYTVADLTAAGWTEVTSLPKSNEELSKYYYVFFATEADLMLAEETHGTQENKLTGVYRTPADPSTNKKMVWTLEYSDTHYYGIRNLADPLLLLQSRENAPYRVQAAWEKIQSEWTQWDFIYADGTWIIKNKLAKGADANDHIGPWDTKNFVDGSVVAGNKEGDDIGNFKIYAISRYTFDNINTDFDYESATAIAPLNITPLIVNAGFEYATGWWNYTVKPGVLNNNSLEYWNGTASNLQFDINQSISELPAGKYELKAELLNSYDNIAAGTNGGRAYLYASVYDGTTTTEYKTVVEPTTERTPTSHQAVLFVPSGIASEDIKVTIGVKTIGTMDARWFVMDNFQLFYCGVDLTALMQNLQDKITEAETINSESLNTGIKGILTTAINNAKNVLETEEDIMAKSSALDQAMSLANSSIAPYADINSLITLCETYAAENYSTVKEESTRTTFTTAISTATTNKENATTIESLNNVYNTLETARQTYVETAFPTAGNSFDVTYKILNAEVVSKDNWNTNANLASNVDYTDAPDVYALDRWDAGSTNGTTVYAKQTINNLANGVYTLTAMARGNGANMYYVYATSNGVEYKEVVIGGGNWGLVTVPNIVVANGVPMELGLKGTNNNTWFSVDNFKLYRTFDVTAMQSVLSGLFEEAKAIATASKPMNATVEATLSSTIDATDVEATDPVEIDNMITALNEAIANAENSIAAYEAITAYIAKANKIDESIAAGYQTAYDNGTITETAETVFQELEVATYNYVTENFDYLVPLSDEWKSDGTHTHAATFYDEHWSGERRAYKNQHDGWGNPKEGYPADSWSIDFEQEVTLPAGEYVFKVAGRKSVDATLELVVTMGETELGTVNDFPNSNAGFGINKAGAASFDANDPAGFAVLTNDKGEVTRTGFGWQWRYVKFALADKATVKVAVHAETSKIYNWVSFGDYTLQMTEETYLNANKPNMDAIEATASALVDTKPMGDDENTALKEALAMTYTTGAQMLAKMNALETAIANANTWRSTYNTEKGKLVAALERFEADYNDAENGALYYMNKKHWATAIEKAQAAAVAKDNLTSHAILTEATTELTAALDAATVSIGEYAALKAAITEANALAGANIGDDPFQRPQSAADALATTEAQSIYDTAEADGEGVTTKTTALEEAITTFNNTALNAPEDGQRFYIKVATEGHSKLGNAVLATLGATGDNNPTGYGLNANNAVKGHLNQAFTFTQVEGNLYNISIERPEGTVYLTYGSLNGSAAGWKNQQIQATTDPENKGEFKIEATAKEGVLKILNTEDNNYLDCQNGGSIYTDTGIEAEEFNFVLASEHTVTLTISAAEWATLILPFNAELPEGVKAYSCAEANGENLTLEEAGSIDANTPYLVSGAAGTCTFTGYGMADKDVYSKGLFTGTYVDYQTTAGSNTYVLQNGAEGVAFYLVGEEAKPMVKAYRCYMTYDAGAGAPVFRIGKGTTGIDNAQLTNGNVVIYDLMGRKVDTMVKGGMYIVNGKKVVIR